VAASAAAAEGDEAAFAALFAPSCRAPPLLPLPPLPRRGERSVLRARTPARMRRARRCEQEEEGKRRE
jgi:hypothetical protein